MTLHVGRRGVPMKCVAKPGNCPLAHPAAHFVKEDKAYIQSFTDEYNRMSSEMEGKDWVEVDLNQLVDSGDKDNLLPSYVAVADRCDEWMDKHYGEKNVTKKMLKNPIKWQKQQRNKYLREMVRLDERQKDILRALDDMEEVIKKKSATLMTDGVTMTVEERKQATKELAQARIDFKRAIIAASPETQKNELLYHKNLNRKKEHGDKLIGHLKERSRVDAVLDKRVEAEEGIRRITESMEHKE